MRKMFQELTKSYNSQLIYAGKRKVVLDDEPVKFTVRSYGSEFSNSFHALFRPSHFSHLIFAFFSPLFFFCKFLMRYDTVMLCISKWYNTISNHVVSSIVSKICSSVCKFRKKINKFNCSRKL